MNKFCGKEKKIKQTLLIELEGIVKLLYCLVLKSTISKKEENFTKREKNEYKIKNVEQEMIKQLLIYHLPL